MYYIIYPLLYLFSLLPFFVLYRISDLMAAILFHFIGYRKKVIMYNLSIAFPEKTKVEHIRIAIKFYKYFTDAFIETIKFISLSKKQIEKRSTGNFEIVNQLIDKGYSINLMAGHQFNWEYANLLFAINLKIPFVGVYMPIKNKVLDRFFFNFRKQFGTVLISATDFKNKMHDVFKSQYMLALAADQNPGAPKSGYWLNFFGRPTPFVTGPEKGALKNNASVVFISMQKVKRGYYHFDVTLLAEQSNNLPEGELTRRYRDILEQTIKQDPANYLWSHRRFKFDWKEEYKDLWIDK